MMRAETALAAACQTIASNNPNLSEARMTLTEQERALCDQFQTFLRSLPAAGITSASVAYYCTRGGFYGAAVHDQHRAFSGGMRGSIADCLQGAINAFSEAHPPAQTAEQAKAARITELREELASLEDAA